MVHDKDKPKQMLDIGQVGEIDSIDPQVISVLEAGGFIPVVAPIGGGANGESFNINPELRAYYWRSYGATLLGMMRHHGTDPAHFLRETHAFPDLSNMVVYERGLAAMLRRLPGRKLVRSNAPAHS